MARYEDDPFDYEDEEDDGFMTFDARDENEGSNRGPFILAGIALLLVVFGAIVWAFYVGGKGPKNEPPQITANNEPFKETPIEGDPSVNAIDATDSVNSVGTTNPPALEVEAIGATEAPLLGQNAVSSPTSANNIVKENPPRPTTREPAKTAAVTNPKPVANPKPAATTATNNNAPKPKPAANVTASKPAETTAPKAAEKPVVGNGSRSAQLGSFKTEDAAQAALAKYRSTGLTGSVTVVKADLGEKGVWYRIKATGFESREQVSSFCSKAKSAGANCIPSN